MSPEKGTNRSLISAVLLFVACVALYGVMAYGGIRTADGEVVFRAGEALAATGSLALEEDLATWPGFAVARGVDGRLYSVFAPGHSILLAPAVKLGLLVNRSRWYETGRFQVPLSFTVDSDSLKDYLCGRQPAHPEKHGLRFLVSFSNQVIAALVVVVFFFIVKWLTVSTPAALATAFLLALATPLWSYAGTMFKEPLTMLWVLLSFYFLIRNDPCHGAEKKRYVRLFLAGLFIGLAFFSHITAILFVPFFLVYGVLPYANHWLDGQGARRGLTAALAFTGGFLVFTVFFCGLNYARFGNIFETGRLISPVTYGSFVPPLEGLAGFLVSPGKGLPWFCPIVMAGIVCWPRFHKSNRSLSLILVAAIIFHWLFLSCRSDWHGGFCLGPRHLLPLLPFFLIPVAVCLSGWYTASRSAGGWRRRLLILFFLGCVIQQVYFCLGEPVSFYYLIKQYYLERGVSVISDNSVYFNWRASPLFFLLEFNRGPFLLRKVGLDNYSLFIPVGIIAGFITVSVFALARCLRQGLKDSRRGEER